MFCNTTVLASEQCYCVSYKICLIFSFLFFVCYRENPHSPMNIFHLIFSGLLDLDPLPAFLCYEYIRTQKKIILFFGGGGNTRLDGKGGGDKNGWGRPWYYQTVLFISSFCGGGKVKVGHSFITLSQGWQLWQWLPVVIKPLTTQYIVQNILALSHCCLYAANSQEKTKVSSLITCPRGGVWGIFVNISFKLPHGNSETCHIHRKHIM